MPICRDDIAPYSPFGTMPMKRLSFMDALVDNDVKSPIKEMRNFDFLSSNFDDKENHVPLSPGVKIQQNDFSVVPKARRVTSILPVNMTPKPRPVVYDPQKLQQQSQPDQEPINVYLRIRPLSESEMALEAKRAAASCREVVPSTIVKMNDTLVEATPPEVCMLYRMAPMDSETLMFRFASLIFLPFMQMSHVAKTVETRSSLFAFSKVFDDKSSQFQIYQDTFQPMVAKAVTTGGSALLFAYGMSNFCMAHNIIRYHGSLFL